MKLLLTALILVLLGVLLKNYAFRNSTYNAHMCATYGYEPDCKTPLRSK